MTLSHRRLLDTPETSNVTATDGTKLFLQRWPVLQKEPGQAHGTVQIVHGLGEHIGRYAAVAQVLNAAGWHVVGHDQRGHGRSEGARGSVPPGPGLLADLAAVIDAVRTPAAPGRHVLLGHSMGGAVAARFVAEALAAAPAQWSRPLDGLVLSSPALDLGMNALQRALLAVLCPLAPDLRIGNGLRPAAISRNPAVVHAYRHDPLVHDRITPRLVRFMRDAGAAALACAPQWRVPTLLLWAGADGCVAPAGSAAFAASMPAAQVSSQAYPELFHEIFNEPERLQVLARLTQWLGSLPTSTRSPTCSPTRPPSRPIAA